MKPGMERLSARERELWSRPSRSPATLCGIVTRGLRPRQPPRRGSEWAPGRFSRASGRVQFHGQFQRRLPCLAKGRLPRADGFCRAAAQWERGPSEWVTAVQNRPWGVWGPGHPHLEPPALPQGGPDPQPGHVGPGPGCHVRSRHSQRHRALDRQLREEEWLGPEFWDTQRVHHVPVSGVPAAGSRGGLRVGGQRDPGRETEENGGWGSRRPGP